MLLIPELKTVLILVPRAGSGSLYRAVLKKYPKAMMPYRHMEADGIPYGYDTWRKVGVVRDPLARLYSLFNFLKNGFAGKHDPAYRKAQVSSVQMSFNDWILYNELTFTGGHHSQGFANFQVLHPMPENRKSQWIYLRPDLGTIIYPFSRLKELQYDLNLEILHVNTTEAPIMSLLNEETAQYIANHFKWDWENYEQGNV